MEFLGRTVKKEFKGFGFFTGTVQSYDESSKFFEIVYEDGYYEELGFSEVASLLENDRVGKVGELEVEPVRVKPRVGRKPKKRRRLERKRGESGKVEETFVRERIWDGNDDLNDGLVDLNVGFVENLSEIDGVNDNFNLSRVSNGEFEETLGHDLRENGSSVNGCLIVDVEIKEDIDLNAGFNFKLHDGLNLNLNDDNFGANSNLQKKKRECIDLNLDVNGELEENFEFQGRQKDCRFDLNLDVDDENKDDRDGKDNKDVDCVADVKEFTSSQMVGESFIVDGALKEVNVTQDFCLGLVGGTQKEESIPVEDLGTQKEESMPVEDLGTPKEESIPVEDFVAPDGSEGVWLKEDFASLNRTVTGECQGDMGSTYKQLSGRRKRRKVIDKLNSVSETVLRRSTRRGSSRNSVLSSKTSHEVNDLPSSIVADVSMEQSPFISDAGRVDEPVLIPPKLQLPHSSRNLDLDGIPVLDAFSIYACLRSFSTLLFLSPFELEDFVTALKSESPTLLFDCIHVSILRVLKKHLEHLSKEGSESASTCLRSLNWGLLDLISWPIFMAAYFLILNSEVNPGLELTCLNLFSSDYYKQPVSVKVEILRRLCDDMIEVESIRMELNRRSSVAEPDMDFDRNMNNEVVKKRRISMDISVSCLTYDVVDDANDWNSDECCLCKMDGNLLCCDGCPAAYHSKCVGVANDLLPEGDWFCPECALDRHKPWMKPRKSLRGAELLGVDPHGRLYFSSCGYLLVLDSCGTESIFNYYHRNDLNLVIDVLKSSDIFCGEIINAICKQWNITADLNGVRNNLGLNALYSSTHVKAEVPAISMASTSIVSETHAVMSETDRDREPEETCVAGYSSHLDSKVSKSENLLDSLTATKMPNISSEGSAETTHMNSGIENFQKEGLNNSNRAPELSNQSETPGKLPLSLGDSSMTSTSSDIKWTFVSSSRNSSVLNSRKGNTMHVQCENAYMNHYSFAQTASSVAEELMHKSPNEISKEAIKPVEEIISTQMKAILKKWDRFYWPNTLKLNVHTEKEKCGWCFSCKALTDDMDCLFSMNNSHGWGKLKSEVAGLLNKRSKKGHLVDVICHILSIEDRLHGLLLGPWLNPHYTKLWHKSALKATDMASVKHLLLVLEANLHHLALSVEWLKPVDSVVTMGSASHIVTASSRASLKAGVGRKKARGSDSDNNPSKNAAGGLDLCWWRGGRVSCQLFSWKRLPLSLVSKSARQAGCMKIPGILYPESSDFAKRSRNVAWRAAVESSTSVEQLAIQVREFDSNIRWDDIENTHPLCTMDKEFRKSARLFKKAIIRRKCLKDAEGVKYLVDFGKRRNVPDIVMKHGSMAEESSSGRKKFWLNESYVPLHLLKSFEGRRIARKSTMLNAGNLMGTTRVIKKSLREKGFSYLFSKAAKSEYYQCGHCHKDVLIREAVCCQNCKGCFHKRHIGKSAGAATAECTYTCFQCQDGRFKKTGMKASKSDAKKGKISTRSAKVKLLKCKKSTPCRKPVQSRNSKKAVVGGRSVRSRNDKKVVAIPLRRSTRKTKFVSVQTKKRGRHKKAKQKSKKKTPQKPKRVISWKKKRTQVYYNFWLNGLLLSRKPDDERVIKFRQKKFLAVSDRLADTLDQPKCHICLEAEYTFTSNYIACEICGEWYHGDAFGLNAENTSKLMGFRCHVCRKRTPPVCPFMGNDASQPFKEQIYKVCKPGVPFGDGELKSNQQSTSNEDRQDSPVDEPFHKEELCSSVLESKLEVEEDHALVSEQNTDSIHISDEDLKPDILTAFNKNVNLEDNTVRVHDGTAALHNQAESSSDKFHGDSMDTDISLLRHDKEKDGLVKTVAILNSPMVGTFMDSIGLHSQTYVTSGELLDGGKTV